MARQIDLNECCRSFSDPRNYWTNRPTSHQALMGVASFAPSAVLCLDAMVSRQDNIPDDRIHKAAFAEHMMECATRVREANRSGVVAYEYLCREVEAEARDLWALTGLTKYAVEPVVSSYALSGLSDSNLADMYDKAVETYQQEVSAYGLEGVSRMRTALDKLEALGWVDMSTQQGDELTETLLTVDFADQFYRCKIDIDSGLTMDHPAFVIRVGNHYGTLFALDDASWDVSEYSCGDLRKAYADWESVGYERARSVLSNAKDACDAWVDFGAYIDKRFYDEDPYFKNHFPEGAFRFANYLQKPRELLDKYMGDLKARNEEFKALNASLNRMLAGPDETVSPEAALELQ